ncbi:MAG: RluA family pseudouridine synthase [Rickettsiales bacterium]|jgi:23S rRNA pseudouridine955/2504/2580 synthase|nr:RluA family pseudouridine synthase [Rickettsiales bacterium]
MIEPVKISPTEDGIRLMRWFGRHYPRISQGEFRKLCRTGQIRINAGRCRGNEILQKGDVLRIPPVAEYAKRTESKEQKTNSGVKFSLADLEQLRKIIIHDDADIVAFNKPAGLAVQGGTGIKKSLDKMAAALFPHDTMLLVHRLDRETSGVIVMAKNQRAAQALAAEFQERSASKVYLALLAGNVSPKRGVIDNFMVKGRIFDSEEAEAFRKENRTKPQRAVTKYEVLNEIPGLVAWVRFSPMTGRTHQLRLHSAYSLGAPIVGDELYGLEKKEGKSDGNLQSLINSNSLFLFACQLTFRHPGTGKIMTLRAELPAYMRGVAKFLEFEIP